MSSPPREALFEWMMISNGIWDPFGGESVSTFSGPGSSWRLEEFESMYGVNAELFDTADEMCGPQLSVLGLKQHVAAGCVYIYMYM